MTQRRARPKNPYIAGRALADGRGFFGREEIFQAIEPELVSPDRGSIVLFGQRRIGKTSILLRLVQTLDPERFLPIYLDLMDRANRPLGEVLHALGSAAALALGQELPNIGDFDNEGEFFEDRVLPELYKASGNRRPCFVLDEFDVLDRVQEKRLSNGAATRTFFPYLRRLMEQEARLGFVFAIGRKAEDLSIDLKSLFKATRSKRVSALSLVNAENLIRTAERDGTLSFDGESVERIFALTSGHPYLTQLYCQQIWDRVNSAGLGDNSLPATTSEDVDDMIPQVLEAGENIFEWIWDGLPAAERVILSVLAPKCGLEGALALDDLTEILQMNGVRILIRELEVAPKNLVDWDLLQERGGGFCFLVELLRLWVVARKPIERVRDELDRIFPLAESLYLSAKGYRSQGDLESCLEQLRKAVLANMFHLKGRLLIAEIETERGNFAEAIRELDEVEKIDRAAARHPLIKTLFLYSEFCDRSKDEDAALAALDRILEISPQETQAQKNRRKIWFRRGNRAIAEVEKHLQNGDVDFSANTGLIVVHLNLAETAFINADGSEGKLRLDGLRARFEAKWRLLEAMAFEQVEDWSGAIRIYLELGEICGAMEEIPEKLERAREQEFLASRYRSASDAIKIGELDRAISDLATLINRRPTYRDAAMILANLVQSETAGSTQFGRNGELKTEISGSEAAGGGPLIPELKSEEADSNRKTLKIREGIEWIVLLVAAFVLFLVLLFAVGLIATS